MRRNAVRRLTVACLSPQAGLLGVVLTLAVCPLAVARAQVEAEVDRYTLTTDDVLHLSVTVTLSGRDKATQPVLAESQFDVVGAPMRETGYSIVNTLMSKYSRYTFTLRPKGVGELAVPVATVNVNGEPTKTQAIRVRVRSAGQPKADDPEQPSGPVPSARDEGDAAAQLRSHPVFAIVCRADREEVYVNQQLTMDIDYYTAYRLPRTPGQEAPQAEGFLAEDVPDPEPEYVTVDGQQYARLTNRWALFATSAGEHTIASAPEEIMLPPLYSRKTFESNRLGVKVKALPAAPAGSRFSGAVGEFVVRLAADKTRIKAGEGLTVKAIVDGTGNIQVVEPPQLRVPDWCKVYESSTKRTAGPRPVGDKTLLGGTAEFEYLVVPRRQGQLTVSQADMVYFRPDTASYETARSEGLTVTVTPGEVIDDAGLSGQGDALRHIRTQRPRLHARRLALVGPVSYVVLALSVLVLTIGAAIRLRADRRLADPARTRAAGAARAARRSLARAQHTDTIQSYELVGEALCQYLSDIFGMPASGVRADEIERELLHRGIAAATARTVREIVTQCYAQRFAPGAGGGSPQGSIAARAGAVIDAIQEEGRRK